MQWIHIRLRVKFRRGLELNVNVFCVKIYQLYATLTWRHNLIHLNFVSGLPGEQDQPRLHRRLQELLPRRPPEGRLETHDRAQEDIRDHVREMVGYQTYHLWNVIYMIYGLSDMIGDRTATYCEVEEEECYHDLWSLIYDTWSKLSMIYQTSHRWYDSYIFICHTPCDKEAPCMTAAARWWSSQGGQTGFSPWIQFVCTMYNVLVFVQLINCPTRTTNQQYKNPNIA